MLCGRNPEYGHEEDRKRLDKERSRPDVVFLFLFVLFDIGVQASLVLSLHLYKSYMMVTIIIYFYIGANSSEKKKAQEIFCLFCGAC